MKINLVESLSYDDVLLIPQFSDIGSRSEIDTSVTIKNFKFSNPIIPANMKTIAGADMANLCYQQKSLCILNRFESISEQISIFKNLKNKYEDADKYIGFSIGVKNEDYENVAKILNAGAKIICIDIAHGDSKSCVNMITFLKKYCGDNYLIIAGNVATREAAGRLWSAGADVIKVGIGAGSLCSTRIETGNGVPSMTALQDARALVEDIDENAKKTNKKPYFIADGGIKNAGDCSKALCFADMVMVGNLLSGTNECPGEVRHIDGITYKEYVGSSTHKANRIEGVKSLVPLKGPAKEVFQTLIEGIQSCCSYQGARNLIELKEKAQFCKITSGGLRESYPHDVMVIK